MDSELCEDMLNRGEDLSQLSRTVIDKRSQTCNIAVVNTLVKELQPALSNSDREACLVPPTPEFNREAAECQHDFSPPLTFVPTPPKAIYDHSDLNNGPSSLENEENLHTPKKGAFDPFAPGPDRLMLAPHCRKYTQESRTSVVRRLHFESSVSFIEIDDHEADVGTTSDDEILLETIYGTLLEAIILMQTAEGISAKVESPPASGSDGFSTPISAPRLTGVADTCPCAPIKPTNKFRNVDKGLCRKLEF